MYYNVQRGRRKVHVIYQQQQGRAGWSWALYLWGASSKKVTQQRQRQQQQQQQQQQQHASTQQHRAAFWAWLYFSHHWIFTCTKSIKTTAPHIILCMETFFNYIPLCARHKGSSVSSRFLCWEMKSWKSDRDDLLTVKAGCLSCHAIWLSI